MSLNFPLNPSDGDVYLDYTFNGTTGAWDKTRVEVVSKTYVDNGLYEKLDVYLLGQPLGIAQLDSNGQISIGQLADIIDDAPSGLSSIGKLAGMFSVLSPTAWAEYSQVLKAGSVNVEYDSATSTTKVKIGNGQDVWEDLEYIVDSIQLADAIADAQLDHAYLAPLDSPTFTGVATLPQQTSIGDVTSTEIARLSGIAGPISDLLDAKLSITNATNTYATIVSPNFSGTASLPTATSIGSVLPDEIAALSGISTSETIQDQLDSLQSEKANLASPTFTGTVAGITKSMVGLSNVENTSDANKPISNATQSALDAKASLSGATFTGDVEGTNLTLSGDLHVAGTTTTVNSKNYTVRDNMVYMNQAGEFDIESAVGDGTDVVYTTTTPHDYGIGDYIVVTGINPTSLNIAGSAGVTISAVTTDTFTAANTSIDTYVSGGLARGKSAANPDLGFAAGYNDGTYHHTGFFRDATDGVWKVFDGYVPEPDTSPFIDTAHESFALADIEVENVITSGTVYPDGIQVKQGVPSLTEFIQKTSSYTLDTLTLRDKVIEVNSTSATTVTIPLDSTIDYPIGTSFDVLQTNTGQVTIAGAVGVTLNYTPGLKLRTRWSSATILKRASNTWLVYGDLTT